MPITDSATATLEPQAPRIVELKGAGRHYLCQDGQLRPSVTAILSAINKPALVPWAANQERAMVTEAAATLYAKLVGQPKIEKPAFVAALTDALGTVKAHTKALDLAANIGTQAHKYVEWILRKDLGQLVGPAPALSPKALVAYRAFDAWRDGVRLIPQRLEQQVWSSTHGYAGTLDILASITFHEERCTAVLDIKTGKAIYAEALLQIVAYIEALRDMGHITGPVYGAVVRLPKVESDPEPEIRVIEPAEQPALFEAFLHVKHLWTWLQSQEQARQDARTRPAMSTSPQGNGEGVTATPTTGAEQAGVTPGAHPGGATPAEGQPTFEEAARTQVLADLATAKAALARQPDEKTWARIVLAYTGVRDVAQATVGLHDLVRVVRGLGKKDPVAIAHVKAILDRPVDSEPSTSTPPTNTDPPSETRLDATGSLPTRPGVESTTSDPHLAAVLVDEGDPREGLLTAIAEAKGQLERQPPEHVWAAIVEATCQTNDLTKADAAVLSDLLVLVRALVKKDAQAIACVSEIIARSKG